MKKSIVLIEDDAWLADSFCATLHAGGYDDIRTFTSAHDAMKAIDKKLPDVIIADLLLGDHTSFTLLHELQSYKDTAQIPVIICTGAGTKELTAARMKSYGVVALLDKAHVTPDQLLLYVAESLDSSKKVIR